MTTEASTTEKQEQLQDIDILATKEFDSNDLFQKIFGGFCIPQSTADDEVETSSTTPTEISVPVDQTPATDESSTVTEQETTEIEATDAAADDVQVTSRDLDLSSDEEMATKLQNPLRHLANVLYAMVYVMAALVVGYGMFTIIEPVVGFVIHLPALQPAEAEEL